MSRKRPPAPWASQPIASHVCEMTRGDRYVLRGRSVYRLDVCKTCGKFMQEKRSRWKSHGGRWLKYWEPTGRAARRRSWAKQSQQSRLEQERRREIEISRIPAVYLLREMKVCERAAAALPQDDDRIWKYHPIARRYRRLMRRWWQLSTADQNQARGKIAIPQWSVLFRWNSPPASAGGAADVQHGRAAKIAKLKARAVKVGDWWIVGSYQFRLFAEE